MNEKLCSMNQYTFNAPILENVCTSSAKLCHLFLKSIKIAEVEGKEIATVNLLRVLDYLQTISFIISVSEVDMSIRWLNCLLLRSDFATEVEVSLTCVRGHSK